MTEFFDIAYRARRANVNPEMLVFTYIPKDGKEYYFCGVFCGLLSNCTPETEHKIYLSVDGRMYADVYTHRKDALGYPEIVLRTNPKRGLGKKIEFNLGCIQTYEMTPLASIKELYK